MSVAEHLTIHARKTPTKPALCLGEKRITYKELDKKTDQIAYRLKERSAYCLEKKETFPPKAAILMDNRTESIEIFLGAAKAGWLAVTFDPKWSEREINTIITDVAPDVLFVEKKYVQTVSPFLSFTDVVVCGVEEEGEDVPFVDYKKWTQLEATHKQSVIKLPHPQDLFYMGFTSGTTGLPKGYIRTHQSWIESFRVWDEEIKIEATDCILVPGPLVHSLFLFAALHAFHCGATCYLQPTYDVTEVRNTIKEEAITVMYGVPTMYEALFQQIKQNDGEYTFSSLQKLISSGAKASANRKQQWENRLPHAEWIEFYGASELSFVAILHHKHRSKVDALGTPFPRVEISVRDSEGNEVPPGEIGELFVRSPMTFSGYLHGDPVMRGEWIAAGDLVWQDKTGLIYLAGRKKNMIVSGGLNVYPEEVEEVLKNHSTVREAVVFGIEDDYWGEVVSAAIEYRGTSPTEKRDMEKELETFCKQKLASYKCPRKWFFVNKIPLTTSGKPARNKLKKQVKVKRPVNQNE